MTVPQKCFLFVPIEATQLRQRDVPSRYADDVPITGKCNHLLALLAKDEVRCAACPPTIPCRPSGPFGFFASYFVSSSIWLVALSSTKEWLGVWVAAPGGAEGPPQGRRAAGPHPQHEAVRHDVLAAFGRRVPPHHRPGHQWGHPVSPMASPSALHVSSALYTIPYSWAQQSVCSADWYATCPRSMVPSFPFHLK